MVRFNVLENSTEMKWFIAENGKQTGPLQESELLAHGLTVNSLVWHDGMEQWTRAAQVPELYHLLGITPPPPPPSSNEPQQAPITTVTGTPVMPQLTQASSRTNVVGLIGFILAIAAFILVSVEPISASMCGVIGAILSFVGLFTRPRGLAVAGCLVSIFGFVIIVATVGFFAHLFGFALNL